MWTCEFWPWVKTAQIQKQKVLNANQSVKYTSGYLLTFAKMLFSYWAFVYALQEIYAFIN